MHLVRPRRLRREKNISVEFDGSCIVVVPNARLARNPQFVSRRDATRAGADVRVRVDHAGHDALARHVDSARVSRNLDVLARRRHTMMRLRSTSIVAFGITSLPFIVITVAPVSARLPVGRSAAP